MRCHTESRKEQGRPKQSPVGVDASVHGCSCMKQLKDVLILTPLEADLIVQHLRAAEPGLTAHVSLLAMGPDGQMGRSQQRHQQQCA